MGGTTGFGGTTTVGTGGKGSGGTTVTGTGGRMFGSGGVTGAGGAGAGGQTTGTGGRTTGAGGRTTGTGGTTVGTGGRTTGAGGTTLGGTGGRMGGTGGTTVARDAGADRVTGTGGSTGTGGGTGGRDAGTTAGDAASSCFTTIVNNGYACGSAPACSACKVNGVAKEAECQNGIDCMAAAGPSCDNNCQLTCLNSAGDAQVGACIKALQTAACGGTGC